MEELRGNLAFRQLDEESIDQMVAHFSELDLSQWEFQYEKGNFTIPFPTKVKGDDTFTVPLSKFYDVIDTERLLPDDLASYQSYIEERHRKMIALTFDDGPDPTTTPQALAILKKYNAKATFFMVGKNVSANPDIAKQVRKEGHQIGNHTWDHPQLPKLSLDNAKKRSWIPKKLFKKRQVCRPRLPVLRMELSITLFNTVLINPSSCGMWIA